MTQKYELTPEQVKSLDYSDGYSHSLTATIASEIYLKCLAIADEQKLAEFTPAPQTKAYLTPLGRDLEYLDKVAIEAMKVYLSNQHIAHVEAMGGNEWVAKNSYEIAQAMLEQSKKVRAELMGIENENTN